MCFYQSSKVLSAYKVPLAAILRNGSNSSSEVSTVHLRFPKKANMNLDKFKKILQGMNIQEAGNSLSENSAKK